MGEVLRWYDAIVASVTEITAGGPPTEAGRRGYASLRAAIDDGVERDPDASLVAAAAADAGGLDRDEVASNAAVLLFGGIETTEGMIANAVLHLLSDPDALAAVRADVVAAARRRRGVAAPRAGRRGGGPLRDARPGARRRARSASGELVIVSIAAANRDPAVFADPDRFDLRRENAKLHLAFAHGPHVCIGMHLARLEAHTAVSPRAGAPARPAARPGVREPAPRGLVFRKPAELRVRWPCRAEFRVEQAPRHACSTVPRCRDVASATPAPAIRVVDSAGRYAVASPAAASIALDLERPADHAIARRLVGAADVVVENFRPGVMQTAGPGPRRADRKPIPRLVYLSFPASPPTTPTGPGSRRGKASSARRWASSPTWGSTASSWASIRRTRRCRSPRPTRAVFGALSVVAALYARERDGLGDAIEVPIAAALLEGLAYNSMRVEPLPARYKALRELEIERRRADGTPLDLDYDAVQRLLDPLYRSYRCADGRPFLSVCLSHRRHAGRAARAHRRARRGRGRRPADVRPVPAVGPLAGRSRLHAVRAPAVPTAGPTGSRAGSRAPSPGAPARAGRRRSAATGCPAPRTARPASGWPTTMPSRPDWCWKSRTPTSGGCGRWATSPGWPATPSAR